MTFLFSLSTMFLRCNHADLCSCSPVIPFHCQMVFYCINIPVEVFVCSLIGGHLNCFQIFAVNILLHGFWCTSTRVSQDLSGIKIPEYAHSGNGNVFSEVVVSICAPTLKSEFPLCYHAKHYETFRFLLTWWV